MIDAGGVEVVETRGEVGVDHLGELRCVDGAVLEQRQAHRAEAEFAVRALERRRFQFV